MISYKIKQVEKSILGLSILDKLELIERLVHELRSSIATNDHESASHINPLSEDGFKRQLLQSGLITSLPTPPDSPPRPTLQPVTISGEPLSETIIRERR